MSALIALYGAEGAANSVTDDEAGELLEPMASRGSELSSVWRSDDVVLAVARDRWEAEPGFAGETLVGARGHLHVVCDATLYYVDDLETKLAGAGVAPASRAASDLIAAAYQAFGARCVDLLEGDYAFCVWDSAAGTLFCARDPFGLRSLFYERADGLLAVASTPHPLVARQGKAARYDPEGALRALLMRYGDGTVTPWRGIRELPAGSHLTASVRGFEVNRFWSAAGSDRWRALGPDEAVAAFRTLLDDACRERFHADSTALAMSGGQDSTAILASLGDEGPGLPDILSFEYPEGDPGDESWYVNLTAERFGLPVRWVPITDLELYADVDRRARLRSHCHGHIFEGHNRALARTSLSMGDRVLLNGHGGDNVLGVGYWEPADLLRRGRLIALRKYLRALGYTRRKTLVDFVLRPALPFALFDLLERPLGRHLCTRPYERPLPAWIDAAPELVDRITREDRRDYAARIVALHSSVTDQRRAWNLMDYAHSRGCAASYDLNRDEGVELRMPFYDRRLVEFSLSRPPEEMIQPDDYKVLLRKAMKGRLPDRTRAPEPGGFKPGTGLGLLKARWANETAAFLEPMRAGQWVLEEIGVVDASRFVEAIETGGALHWWSSVDVSLTLFGERWLRANRARQPLRGADTNVAPDRQEEVAAIAAEDPKYAS